MTDLSILIVNWNTCQLLSDCLDSVATDVAQSSMQVQTIVVDNASSDGSVEMVRTRHRSVLLIANDENVGFARGNNQALEQATGRYVMLLNSDTVLRPGALSELVEYLDAHPKVGACGPMLLNADGSLQPSCHPMLTPWREFWRLSFMDRLVPLATYRQESWSSDIPREVEVIKGACLVLRSAALDQVGFLDDRYFMYTEEMDLCLRLLRASWLLYYVPKARVVHVGEASSKQVADEMYVELYRSKVQFYKKFGGERRAMLFKYLVALAYVPRWLITFLSGSSGRSRRKVFGQLLSRLPNM